MIRTRNVHHITKCRSYNPQLNGSHSHRASFSSQRRAGSFQIFSPRFTNQGVLRSASISVVHQTKATNFNIYLTSFGVHIRTAGNKKSSKKSSSSNKKKEDKDKTPKENIYEGFWNDKDLDEIDPRILRYSYSDRKEREIEDDINRFYHSKEFSGASPEAEYAAKLEFNKLNEAVKILKRNEQDRLEMLRKIGQVDVEPFLLGRRARYGWSLKERFLKLRYKIFPYKINPRTVIAFFWVLWIILFLLFFDISGIFKWQYHKEMHLEASFAAHADDEEMMLMIFQRAMPYVLNNAEVIKILGEPLQVDGYEMTPINITFHGGLLQFPMWSPTNHGICTLYLKFFVKSYDNYEGRWLVHSIGIDTLDGMVHTVPLEITIPMSEIFAYELFQYDTDPDKYESTARQIASLI